MSYDPVSEQLGAIAPVSLPGLVEVMRGYEGLTIAELEERFARCEADFRAWVLDPANEDRPTTEAPVYLDRIALGSLLERRSFWE